MQGRSRTRPQGDRRTPRTAPRKPAQEADTPVLGAQLQKVRIAPTQPFMADSCSPAAPLPYALRAVRPAALLTSLTAAVEQLTARGPFGWATALRAGAPASLHFLSGCAVLRPQGLCPRTLLLACRLGQSLGSVPLARNDPLKRLAKLLRRFTVFFSSLFCYNK